LSVDELLAKAIDTGDLDAGGLLNADQADKFIDYVVDQSVMIRHARVVRMRSATAQIDKISTTGRVSKPKTEGVAPTTFSEPSFSKVALEAVGVITPFEVTYEALEDNIEGGSAEETLIRTMTKQTSTDLEELAIQGDTGSADDYLALLDGWRVLAEDGHVVDQAGASVDKDLFVNMVKALPDKYKRGYGDLRFYFAPAVIESYRGSLAEGDTVIGAEFLLQSPPLTVFGIPVVSVPLIPTDLDGIEGTAGTGFSYAFLTPKSNLVWGIHRDIRVDKDKDIMRGVNQYAITTRVACEFEEDDAVVYAINVAQ
jgi:HK97 family phage major capsid protein